MITGLPDYEAPTEQTLRCLCGRWYVVSFTGADVRSRAERLNAELIDTREVPFMNCECGMLLDFQPEDVPAMVN